MSLSRLLIKDFRNIEQADLALSPGFNFLVGANGSGKTSVLEAIYTLGHVLFVERSGELRLLARLSTQGAEPKGNQVLRGREVSKSRPETG